MGTVISASRRTDIPAFYARWLIHRLREGFCFYPNPYDPRRHHRVDLRPESVSGLVLWTRDPRPLMKHLSWLESSGYAFCFQFTLNNYPSCLDPGIPGLEVQARAFRELAERIGAERVIWRYDPIILGGDMDMEWHLRNLRRIMDALGGAARRLIISAVDPYRRARSGLKRALGEARFDPESYTPTLVRLAEEAGARGILVQGCCEPQMEGAGLRPGRCVDAFLLAGLSGRPLGSPPSPHRQREGCLCHRSVDIGAYDTCPAGCVYCYAVKSISRARAARHAHDHRWPCLTCPEPER